ncbi:TPA: H-NS histone family protein [Stenotrophomonas maltophilia]|nr:H-NS histone family protein [Stenotrophomonas maltophilia]
MALTTLKSLDAEIRQLEAQKKLVEKRDGEVPKALAVLQKYAKVLTPAQRRQVAKLIGQGVEVEASGAAKAAKVPSKARKLGKVAPKYRLPNGATWTGRGLTPKVFAAWLKSAEGKDWSAANPGEGFPAAGGKKATTRPVKKSAGGASVGKKQAVKAPVKKAAKKVVRKASRKPKAS